MSEERVVEVVAGALSSGGYCDNEGVWHEGLTVGDMNTARAVLQALADAGFVVIAKEEREAAGCWLWPGWLDNDGYGLVQAGPSLKRAHRAMYELSQGAIPKGVEIDHVCRRRNCVNPAHLEAVTHTENLRRGAGTKLTAEQVDEIRSRSESSYALAQEYGVSPTTIQWVRNGRQWADTLREAPPQRRETSEHRGVSQERNGLWRAQAYIDRQKRVWLGRFRTEQEAVDALAAYRETTRRA